MSTLIKDLSPLKIEIKRKVDTLDREDLCILNSQINNLLTSGRQYDRLQQKLDQLIFKNSLTPKEQVFLIKAFHQNWDEIKKDNKITKAFIKFFEEYCPLDQITGKPKEKDSRTGYFFEEKFYSFLALYLQKDFTTKKNASLFEVLCNKYISTDNLPYKQRPDILIKSTITNKALLITELKKSFTKGTLKREYSKQSEKWKSILHGPFLYTILSVSPSKVKVYKQVEGCRIVCTGLRTSSLNVTKHEFPRIIDSIESIFEEIHFCLKKTVNQTK
jgi:hypothetical protein